MAHFADVPIVACDHISLSENESGTTSVYLARVGKGPQDPQKIDGVRLFTPKGSPRVEISRARPSSDVTDEWYLEVSWDLAFTNGSSTSVVRTEGFKP